MKQTFVYVISVADEVRPVKIGVSALPEQRLAALQCAHYAQLALRSTVTCESAYVAHCVETLLHERYAAKHIRGEWFDVDASEVKKDLEALGHYVTQESVVSPAKQRALASSRTREEFKRVVVHFLMQPASITDSAIEVARSLNVPASSVFEVQRYVLNGLQENLS